MLQPGHRELGQAVNFHNRHFRQLRKVRFQDGHLVDVGPGKSSRVERHGPQVWLREGGRRQVFASLPQHAARIGKQPSQ